MVALQARSNASHGPRELFSISQVEKAFGPAYAPQGTEGCIRAWGERYLTGLKEPELTYEQALALPQGTQEEKKERSSYIAKSFGKALEARADEWFETGTARFNDEPGKRLFPGLHLLPHPSQLDVLPAGRRGYHKQVAISTKLLSFNSPEALSFQGFKDAIFQVGGARFLVDYKTTKPKVDNRKNAELGKPAGWWTWMKTPEQLLGDYQWNLYQWDEYCKHGAFIPSRWVYFASQETPQARAVDVQVSDIDTDRVKSICTQLADRANALRGYIREWRHARGSGDERAMVASLPKNITNCNAFGRLCPYHVRSPGGTCAGGDDQVIPVGQLLSAPNSRPIKSVDVPAFEPGAFQFTSADTGAKTDMSIRDTINQQLAQQQQQVQQQQAPQGYPPPAQQAPQAPQGFVPQGQPPAGALPQGAPQGFTPFQPAPGQPGFAGPQPHVGPPEYQQAFQPAPAPQAAPPQPAPAPARPQAPQGFGAPAPGNPDYFSDGTGGWLDRTGFAAACEYYGWTAAPPPAQAPVQTSPIPAVAQASVAHPSPALVEQSQGAGPGADVADLYEITGTVSRNGVVISAPLSGEIASSVLAAVLATALGVDGEPGAPAAAAEKKSRGRPKKSA